MDIEVENALTRNKKNLKRKIMSDDNSRINVRNLKGETPLHLAVQNEECSEEMVKLLLKHGADVKATTPRDGNTALHWSIINCMNCDHYIKQYDKIRIADILLERGCDVNARNSEGYTPLHLAVHPDTTPLSSLLATLLKHGSDVDAGDFKGDTPLHFLMQHKRSIGVGNLRSFLEKTRDVNVVNSKGETPLHSALRSVKSYETYYENIDPHCIEILLDHGADASKRDAMGENALQAYCRAVEEVGRKADRQLQIIIQSSDQLLANSSPLHVACLFHRVDSVRELLRLGADVNAIDKLNFTPLAYAFIRFDGDDSVDKYWTMRLMLDNGADINHQVSVDDLSNTSILDMGFNSGSCKDEHGATRAGIPFFYEHLAKLSALREKKIERGINVAEVLSEWNREHLRGLEGTGYHRTRISAAMEKTYNDWLSRYSEELRAMGETKVGESGRTFLDLLIAETAATFVKNKELVEAFHAKKAMFPLYQGMLDAKVARDLERRKLIDSAAVSLSDALGFADPSDEFFERTLSYCSNKDLISLIDGLKEKE